MNGFTQPAAWILFLPLIGWLVQCLIGKRVIDQLGVASGRRVMGALAVAFPAAAFAIGVKIVSDLAAMPAESRVISFTIFEWIKLNNLSIPFELRADTLSMTMVMVITGIGSLIHLYATGYMAEEKDYPRFFAYLNLFVAFMLLLVLGNNLAMLFIGWEGVGLCSYLLIGFWYKDIANAKAANKAFIVNRIGDVGLTVGMFLIAALVIHNRAMLPAGETRWLSYDVLFSTVKSGFPAIVEMLRGDPSMATAIALCLFVGACGKSAQFPLYLWLPDAMAGPTPVSALIHAATMVTSGVVLLNRMHMVFEMSPTASAIVCVVGTFTAVFAALIAFGQTDIKKVLAYSTVSQLGFMFIACGAGYYWVAMFHVITHAFFKALLFLGSGAVIHAMSHDQDMRNYGGLAKFIKITCWTMVIGWFAIAGVPFFSGWFSKEAILSGALAGEFAVIGGVNVGAICGWIGFGAALLTAIYMTRMMMLTFYPNGERWRAIQPDHHHEEEHHAAHAHHEGHDHGPDTYGFFYTDTELAAMPHEHEHHHALDKDHKPHEVPPSMWVPLVVLAGLSLIGGFWLMSYFGQRPGFLEHWLYPDGLTVIPEQLLPEHPHAVNQQLLWFLGNFIGIVGMVFGFAWYLRGLPKSEGWDESKWNPARILARRQFGYDELMVDSAVEGGGAAGMFLWKVVDALGIDGLVNGIAGTLSGLGSGLRKTETGYARSYALLMLTGSLAFAIYIVYVLARAGGHA